MPFEVTLEKMYDALDAARVLYPITRYEKNRQEHDNTVVVRLHNAEGRPYYRGGTM
ncbi:hypothetical protein D3C86_2030690 [compost metagenome]